MSVTLLAAFRSLLALVFAISAFTKLVDRSGFKSALEGFGLPERLQVPITLLVPPLELAIAIALLPATSSWPAAACALVLLIVFSAAIVVSLARGRRPDCHCFGQLSSAPVSWRTLLRNGLLMAVAAAVVAGESAKNGPSMVSWATRLPLWGALGVVAVVVVIALVGTQTWMFVHVLRQNGRLLLRLDALETTLAHADFLTSQAGGKAAAAPIDARVGLPVGAPAPAFRLDRLDGGTSTMTELLASGKPVALAFVDPHCGPCAALLPELARWRAELASQVTVAIITRGTIEANTSKLAGLDPGHVLVQKDREVSEAFRAYGTPSMILVEADGTIGSLVAPGLDAIR
jgi:thiol-disulfide isomerase/thioredoxin